MPAYIFGAGDGIWTRDFNLGKVALYHWVTPAYITKQKNMEATSRFELEIEILQTSALPLGYVALGAGDGIWTRDFNLGKVALYHWVTPAWSKDLLQAKAAYVKQKLTIWPENMIKWAE